MKKVVIEFVGLPASGKTTAMRSLSLEASFIKRIPVEEFYTIPREYSKIKLIGLFILFVFRNPRIIFSKIRLYVFLKFKIIEKFKIIFLLKMIYYNFIFTLVIKNTDETIIVLDQGLIQKDWSYTWKYTYKDSKLTKNVFKDLYTIRTQKLNVIPVFFQTEPFIAAKRAQLRTSQSSVDDLPIKDLEKLYFINDKRLNNYKQFFNKYHTFVDLKQLNKFICEVAQNL